jgi:hypothetical protein
VYAALVEAGWAIPSNSMVIKAACSHDAEAGITLLNTLKGAGYDEWLRNPAYKYALPLMALVLSTPSLLQYLRDAFDVSTPPEPNMIILAVEGRESGGVEMLTWLLGHGLDVNFRRPVGPPPSDPRERAEQEMANRANGISDQKTALHAAAWQGNAEAVKFLLEQGANPLIQDGKGQTAEAIARRRGWEEVADMLRNAKSAGGD